MSEGLPKSDTLQEEEEIEDNVINAKKMQTRPKTKQQKKKKKEQFLLQAELKKLKMEKKKVADLYKLRQLEKGITKKEQKTAKLKELRRKKLEYKNKEAKRIGPSKYEEQDLDFNAAEDITGNLLFMKKEGNLLADRFKSLQRRSIIPAANVIINPKKAKIKKYTRPGYKDDWKVTVAGFK